MGNTSIEWTDKTWSPLRVRVKYGAANIAKDKGYTSLVKIAEKMAGHIGPHCEHVSHGCDNCYADTNNHRCLPANGTGLPFDRRSRDLVDPFVDENALLLPLKWRKPSRIFVENQSDLFGEWVPARHIDKAFAVMSQCPQHTFQILTKRPDAMLGYITAEWTEDGIDEAAGSLGWCHANVSGRWPLPNVWLGVSVENQATADARIPLLVRTPAVIRFVSYEPALGPVDFDSIPFCLRDGHPTSDDISGPLALHYIRHGIPGIDWMIIGGESGPGARPFDIAWAQNAVNQCKDAGVAAFVKQLGSKPVQVHGCSSPLMCRLYSDVHGADGIMRLYLKSRKGGNPLEWPKDLQVREFPA